MYIAVCALLFIVFVIYCIKHHNSRNEEKQMAQGLQCWDADGKLIFDSSVQTTYVLGSGSTGTGQTGSLYDARLIGYDNQFWVQITSMPAEQEFIGYSTPVFSLSNGTLSWKHEGLDNVGIGGLTRIVNKSFIYGVY